MSELAKRYLPQGILVVVTVIGIIEYFTPFAIFDDLMNNVSNMSVIVSASMAILLSLSSGVWHIQNVRRRGYVWQSSLYFVIAYPLFFLLSLEGTVWSDFMKVYTYMAIPLKGIWFFSAIYVFYYVFRPSSIEVVLLGIFSVFSLWAGNPIGGTIPGVIEVDLYVRAITRYTSSALAGGVAGGMIMMTLQSMFGVQSAFLKGIREQAAAGLEALGV
jgi:hypothetical protein